MTGLVHGQTSGGAWVTSDAPKRNTDERIRHYPLAIREPG